MPAPFRHVERELQRARAARRMAPFAAFSAACAAAIVGWVGHSVRAGLWMLVPGALLVAFAAAAGVPRCPECGGSLWRRGESPGSPAAPRPTQVERERHCPRCGVHFE